MLLAFILTPMKIHNIANSLQKVISTEVVAVANPPIDLASIAYLRHTGILRLKPTAACPAKPMEGEKSTQPYRQVIWVVNYAHFVEGITLKIPTCPVSRRGEKIDFVEQRDIRILPPRLQHIEGLQATLGMRHNCRVAHLHHAIDKPPSLIVQIPF